MSVWIFFFTLNFKQLPCYVAIHVAIYVSDPVASVPHIRLVYLSSTLSHVLMLNVTMHGPLKRPSPPDPLISNYATAFVQFCLMFFFQTKLVIWFFNSLWINLYFIAECFEMKELIQCFKRSVCCVYSACFSTLRYQQPEQWPSLINYYWTQYVVDAVREM